VDPVYITAISALGGATIGGLTSFLGSWLTQRTQLRFTHHTAIKANREALYAEFVDEASRLYGERSVTRRTTSRTRPSFLLCSDG
jgi:hypothetical protein